jgi:hypothetical protein
MRSNWFIALASVILLTSCEDAPPHRSVRVPEKTIPFSSSRFDHAVFRANYGDPAAARTALQGDYGRFFCHYLEDILRIGPCDSDSSVAALSGFATWPDMVELQQQIDAVYPASRISELDREFRDVMLRWNYFFPDSVIPSVVYMNSGLNFSAFCTDSVFATGLDFFLGLDNPVVAKLPSDFFPQYLREDMKQDYAVVNTVKDFCQREVSQAIPFADQPDMLNLLLFHGKVMYALDLLLPEAADSVKMNWTSAQWEWAAGNEWNTWKELARQEVMFGTSMKQNVPWFDFGPFTNAGNIPHESPPQLGIWMGWNIVRAYMKKNPETTVQNLLAGIPDRTILQAYQPVK